MLVPYSAIQKTLLPFIPLVFALTLHEIAHGWVANQLGDPTAKQQGRLTLNPLKHIDLVGTILVPLLFLLVSPVNIIFGWAKPIPIRYENLSCPRRDIALIAVAGPLANFFMAIFWTILLKLASGPSSPYPLLTPDSSYPMIVALGMTGMTLNILLMLLNLIPLPPLDGSRIMSSLLPARIARYYHKLNRWGILIIVILISTGILSDILRPSLIFMVQWFTEVFDLSGIQLLFK